MIELVTKSLEQFVAVMNAGGLAMWILFILNLVLWYGLGYRRLILRRRTAHNVRSLIRGHIKAEGKRECRGILDHAIFEALKAASEANAIGKKPREYIYDVLWPYQRTIKKHAILIQTIVMVAPLIGLLGTVVGMIETFDALQTSAMFSQGDSISGGVSKALFTTELGLIVAVPGLIIGRTLDRKQRRFETEFDQVTKILCSEVTEYEA